MFASSSDVHAVLATGRQPEFFVQEPLVCQTRGPGHSPGLSAPDVGVRMCYEPFAARAVTPDRVKEPLTGVPLTDVTLPVVIALASLVRVIPTQA